MVSSSCFFVSFVDNSLLRQRANVFHQLFALFFRQPQFPRRHIAALARREGRVNFLVALVADDLQIQTARRPQTADRRTVADAGRAVTLGAERQKKRFAVLDVRVHRLGGVFRACRRRGAARAGGRGAA